MVFDAIHSGAIVLISLLLCWLVPPTIKRTGARRRCRRIDDHLAGGDGYLLKVVEEYGDAQKYPNPPASNITKL